MKKIKFYAPVYLLAMGLSLGAPSINAYAEEEVLFEQEEDDYQLEDIEDESQKTDEQKQQEAAEKEASEQQAAEDATKDEEEAARIEEDKEAQEDIIGSTDIDPEDEEYNTGREEIPDTVDPEYKRKDIDRIPENPKNPENPENPGQPENPETTSTQEVSTTTEVQVIPEAKIEIPVTPKTGLNENTILGIGIAGGLGAAAIGLFRDARNKNKAEEKLINGNRVTNSRKKFRKKSKNKTLNR